MCNVQDAMNNHYASQGQPTQFPAQSKSRLQPDVDFEFNEHGQPPSMPLNVQTGAPTIIRIGEAANVQQPPQMTQQT
eukprot:4344549-Amphidinium_carterae.1